MSFKSLFICLTGTPFAVNAFCNGEIENVKYYFLTNFHIDNYVGLNKSFSKSLLCSSITGNLHFNESSVATHAFTLNVS